MVRNRGAGQESRQHLGALRARTNWNSRNRSSRRGIRSPPRRHPCSIQSQKFTLIWVSCVATARSPGAPGRLPPHRGS